MSLDHCVVRIPENETICLAATGRLASKRRRAGGCNKPQDNAAVLGFTATEDDASYGGEVWAGIALQSYTKQQTLELEKGVSL